MSTIDPGQSYVGKIVVRKIKNAKLPQRVTITVNWNGEQYPFAFQLAKAGTLAPEFTELTPLPVDPEQESAALDNAVPASPAPTIPATDKATPDSAAPSERAPSPG